MLNPIVGALMVGVVFYFLADYHAPTAISGLAFLFMIWRDETGMRIDRIARVVERRISADLE